MPAQLQIYPVGGGNVVPFGPVLPAGLTLYLLLKNIGNAPLVFSAVPTITVVIGNPDFSIPNAIPNTVAPGAYTLLAVTFTPTATAGSVETSTLQFYSNSLGNQSCTLTGTAAQSSDVFFQLTQSDLTDGVLLPAVADFGVVGVGSATTLGPFTLINKSSSDTIPITLTPLASSGYALSTIGGTIPVPPGGAVTFKLVLTAATTGLNNDDLNAVVITSTTALTYPAQIEATFQTILLNPVYSLTDGEEVFLLAFGGLVYQAQPLNLNCETAALATRQYIFGSQWTVKSLERWLMLYERLGPAVVSITYAALSPTGPNTPPIPVTTVKTFDAATDGLLRNILFDGQLANDVVQITINVAGGAGPFSMVMFTPYVDERGETIETT